MNAVELIDRLDEMKGANRAPWTCKKCGSRVKGTAGYCPKCNPEKFENPDDYFHVDKEK
jgi:rubrerythrin